MLERGVAVDEAPLVEAGHGGELPDGDEVGVLAEDAGEGVAHAHHVDADLALVATATLLKRQNPIGRTPVA